MTDAHRDVIALLTHIGLFSGLPPEALEMVAASLVTVHLDPGEALFAEGDASDGLYVVLSGRVRVNVNAGDREAFLHELGRGEVFGEVSLVAATPRTATVRASRETTVLHLSREVFEAIVRQHPSVGMKLAAALADRLVSIDRQTASPPGCRTLLLDLRGAPDPDRFVDSIVEATGRLGSTLLIRPDDRPAGAAGDPREGGVAANLAAWLRDLEAAHDTVILLGVEDAAWNLWCKREADALIEVRSATRTGAVDAEPSEPWLMHHVVLVHPAGTTRAGGMRRPDNGRAHHVRDGSVADIDRVVRMVTGRAYGVVLSGGGARGFAHLGVLRALEEAGHPIDVIGGTSIGAVAGALLAVGYEHEERVEILSRALKRRRSVFPLTLPVLSIASDHKVEALLEDFCGGLSIEDLWVGFFCVSANLTRAETVVHEAGPLAAALRATFSLPGVLPPVVKDGDLLIDGGVMNNLPVDVMRRAVGGGEITAIDLRPVVDLRMVEGSDRLPDWRALAGNLAGTSDHPTVIDVLMRTVELGSAQAQRVSLEAAGVTRYLRPPASNVRLSDFRSGAALVELGYRYAVEELSGTPSIT